MQLVSQDGLLQTYYEPYALLVTDDAMQFAGLLVSTNTIDCDFNLHPQKLDHLPDVIDLSMYLRDGNYLKAVAAPEETTADTSGGRYVLHSSVHFNLLVRSAGYPTLGPQHS